MNPRDIGRRIAALRERRGLTQEELGEKAGISDAYVSFLERGKRPLKLDLLQKLAAQLDAVVAVFLFAREDETVTVLTDARDLERLDEARTWDKETWADMTQLARDWRYAPRITRQAILGEMAEFAAEARADEEASAARQ